MTEGRQPTLEAALAQSVDQRNDDPAAASANRVPERDGAAVYVQAVPVQAERSPVGQNLGRERLVQLDQIIVIERRTGSLE